MESPGKSGRFIGNTFSLCGRTKCLGRSVRRWKNVSDLLPNCSAVRRWQGCAVSLVLPVKPATRSSTVYPVNLPLEKRLVYEVKEAFVHDDKLTRGDVLATDKNCVFMATAGPYPAQPPCPIVPREPPYLLGFAGTIYRQCHFEKSGSLPARPQVQVYECEKLVLLTLPLR